MPAPARPAAVPALLALVLGLLLLGLPLLRPPAAAAAELLQVRGASLLQIGDRNRSYPVQLACLTIPADAQLEARRWLRQELPRGTALNLRPIGASDGMLIARVSRLGDGQDLSDALIDAGLAQTAPCG